MTASIATDAAPQPKGAKAPKERRPLRSRWLGIWSALVYIWLFAPIVVVVAFSFNDPAGKFNTAWNEFTFDNWLHPFAKADYTDALIVSLKVAAVSCVIATILGGLMALAISRYEFRGKGFVNIILVLPLTTPEIVMGSSLFTLFFARNLDFGFSTVVIAHILFCVSFVALTVQARVRGFDWSLEDAALDLGSTPLRTFWTITFPMLSPSLFFCTIMTVIGAFKVFTQPYMLTKGGPGDATNTLVLFLYRSGFSYDQLGFASSLAWVLFVIVMLVTALQFVGQKHWVEYDA